MFVNRVEAGRRLAKRLEHLRGAAPVVLGLPRGGVPVAAEVAEALGAPLDVILVRKLGVPSQPELGVGAIGEDGARVINEEIARLAGVRERDLVAVEARERIELDRRARLYRGARPRLELAGRTAVVVDDGIATGSTARVACQVARAHGARRVVLAVPVAPGDWVERLSDAADELVCVETHEPFYAIGQWYQDFSQTPDGVVISCLERLAVPSGGERGGTGTGSSPVGDAADAVLDPTGFDGEIVIPIGHVGLAGHLVIPNGAAGLVIFAHGSGSSRHSPRNRYVAEILNQAGFATLLFDLLTVDEEADRANVFDIELLGQRLGAVTIAVRARPEVGRLGVGYFGASTGAAAALWAAADPDNEVVAVVSRGGRPDLAGARLASVRAPTLLIVGGDDHTVLELNRVARTKLNAESSLAVVAGASHLFEEPGTLLEAACLARDWFVEHLTR